MPSVITPVTAARLVGAAVVLGCILAAGCSSNALDQAPPRVLVLLDVAVGPTNMVASVEPSVPAKRGDKLRFALNPERLLFFDAISEAAI